MKNLKIYAFVTFALWSNVLLAQECLNYFPGNEIYSITEDDENIWFGTECRIVKFNKSNSEVEFITCLANQECQEYKNLISSNNILWYGSYGNGLYKYEEQEWVKYDTENSDIPSNYIYDINVDNEGSIWLLCSSNDIVKFQNDEFIIYSIQGYNPFSFDIDSNNNIWFTTSSTGIVKFDGSVFNNYNTSNSNLISDEITSIHVDNQNNIWIGSIGYNENFEQIGYLSQYNGSDFTNYSEAEGFSPQNIVNTIDSDTNNNIWLATQNGEIKFDGSVFYSYTSFFPTTENKNVIITKTLNSNDIAVGTNFYGAFVLSNQNWQEIQTSNSVFPAKDIYSIETDNDYNIYMLIGGEGYPRAAYVEYDNTDWTVYEKNIFSGNVPTFGNDIHIGQNENIYVASNSQLWVYNNNIWQLNESDLAFNVNLHEHNSLLYAATGHRGLQVFDNYWTTLYFPTSTPFYDVTVDNNNNIWFCSWHTLYKMTGDDIIEYNCNNSPLPCNLSPKVLLSNELNNIYIGGASGMANLNYETNTWMFYEIYQINDIKKAENGDLWIATSLGLYHYNGSSWMLYNVSNSDIISNFIYDIVIGEDNLWLATNRGLVDFKFCGGETININNYVLNTESINRKENYSYVFPNPIKEEAIIKFYNPESKNFTLYIYDTQGRILKRKSNIKSDNIKITNSKLSSGLFFYILTNKEKSINYFGKIIIE